MYNNNVVWHLAQMKYTPLVRRYEIRSDKQGAFSFLPRSAACAGAEWGCGRRRYRAAHLFINSSQARFIFVYCTTMSGRQASAAC